MQYYPNNAIALNNFAAILREKEDYKNAEKVYIEARKILVEGSPVDFSDETIRNIQKVNYVIGLYGRAIESRPNYTNAYYHLGILLNLCLKHPS